jgi:hypothetical protein
MKLAFIQVFPIYRIHLKPVNKIAVKGFLDISLYLVCNKRVKNKKFK